MERKRNHNLKLLFLERMKELLPDKEDYEKFLEIIKEGPRNFIRVNKIKISPEELKKRLEKKGWKIKQPFKNYPEIMIVESQLLPGELGRSLEHLLGYYYIQEIVSMLPVIALNPKPNENILDLCASPGSKTTQIASEMNNQGNLIANEVSIGRIKILASNLERCGVSNVVITKKEGIALGNRINKMNFLFDKILVDAPCSGDGTLRSSLKTAEMWNINTVYQLSAIQKRLFESAFEILKDGGEIIYSTCTHAPEENEEIVSWILERFKGKIKIEKLILPKEIRFREGIKKWKDKEYNDKVKYSCRIYPQDNDTEGFFLAKFKKIKN